MPLYCLILLLAAAFLSASPPDSLRGKPGDPPLRPLPGPALENLYQVSTNLFSGGSPESEEAFLALQNLGVKTLISVDGAKPHADLARKFGMRYIHIPIGYDRVSSTNTLKLIKAARTAQGPLFIHCHHGKHRGPAAAALICLDQHNWTTNRALAWLQLAGTAPEYDGLYQTVRSFAPPTASQLASVSEDFPAQAPSSPMVDAMVQIDLLYEKVSATRAAPPEIAQAALLLAEQFTELARDPGPQSPEAFLQQFRDAAEAAHAVHRHFNSPPSSDTAPSTPDPRLRLKKSCAQCHKDFRN